VLVLLPGNMIGPPGQQLNVTGSSINPHVGPDIELSDNFEDIVQSSAQWGRHMLGDCHSVCVTRLFVFKWHSHTNLNDTNALVESLLCY